uniref:Poly [ADP-ribose] polymerase n=1 Tax=Mola mola TaxID=94237 RepID=A0A3Q3WW47_MOLML
KEFTGRPDERHVQHAAPDFQSAVGQNVTSPSLGVYRMQMGQMTLEVSSGDITKETCDAIVNSSNTNFTLKTGVSQAILDGAGPTVPQECAQIVNSPGYQPRPMILTSAGQLPSRAIIHVVGRNEPTEIKNIVLAVLKLCEENSFQSVSFPALGTAALPSNWADMKGELLKLVALAPGSEEYKDVENKMKATGLAAKIITIERVQNPTLWQSYQLMRKQLEKKNGHTNNEKQLFHGTAASSIDLINRHGFNRSYAGKHAAAFGNGTYFAVNPAYSAQGYAQPDLARHKRMYLARVLVGDFTQGRAGLVTPPNKNTGNPSDLYDSVTDISANPTMFIVFNDIQAYPEYLITFT